MQGDREKIGSGPDASFETPCMQVRDKCARESKSEKREDGRSIGEEYRIKKKKEWPRTP